MHPPLLSPPLQDPTPIFEAFRGSYSTELLTAAVAHFHLFDDLASRPLTLDQIQNNLQIATRPALVLITALRAMGLVTKTTAGQYSLTPLAREHLLTSSGSDITGYLGLAAESPGVLAMVERLRSNRPAGMGPEEEGAAFIYREGQDSAMEKAMAARRLTLALAGRARCVAPVLARNYPLHGIRRLLDVAGGTGLYSIAWLQHHPELRAVIWDRPEVLKVAEEFANVHGVADRIELIPGDMFTDPVPLNCDAMLLSNVLHDWDIPSCQQLLQQLARTLPRDGQLLIHDVFLNDELDGPLPVALYSASLFTLTEGRAYSQAEYTSWLREAGLEPGILVPTLVHCGVLPSRRK